MLALILGLIGAPAACILMAAVAAYGLPQRLASLALARFGIAT